MEFRIANLSIVCLAVFALGLPCWGVPEAGVVEQEPTVFSFVEDDAALLGESARAKLEEDLLAYSERTDCRILVKTLDEATDKKRQSRIFGRAWERWGRPNCAVAFYFIRESMSSRMVLAPTMGSRLSGEEIGAILKGVVVPRFTVDDPEGAVLAGVQSLKVALLGELEEVPGTFRARGNDRAIGMALIVLAATAVMFALRQVGLALSEKRAQGGRAP